MRTQVKELPLEMQVNWKTTKYILYLQNILTKEY